MLCVRTVGFPTREVVREPVLTTVAWRAKQKKGDGVTSKKQVENILSEYGAKEAEGAGLIGLVPMPPDKKRTQMVYVVWDGSGEGFWIASTFASSGDLSAGVALKLSEDIPYGISTVDGDFQVKHYMYFDDVTEERLKQHYLMVAMWADRLEQYTGEDKH